MSSHIISHLKYLIAYVIQIIEMSNKRVSAGKEYQMKVAAAKEGQYVILFLFYKGLSVFDTYLKDQQYAAAAHEKVLST